MPSSAARDQDCTFTDPACLQALNDSSGDGFVDADLVMAHLERLQQLLKKSGDDKAMQKALWAGSDDWLKSFLPVHCETFSYIDFPTSSAQLEELRTKLTKLRRNNSLDVGLVHVDAMTDGIGARVKKSLQLIAASLEIGFDSAVLNTASAGGIFRPIGVRVEGDTAIPDASILPPWGAEPLWCHESSLRSPGGDTREFPWICWAMSMNRDFFAQSDLSAERVLFWGSASASRQPPKAQARKLLNCLSYTEHKDESVFEFVKRQGLRQEHLDRMFASVRSFVDPRKILSERHETQCGYGDRDAVHVAMHLRRGDVGEQSGYAINQQLGLARFRSWLCRLAGALGPSAEKKTVYLHVFSEARGGTRASLRATAPQGFTFPPEVGDDKEVFHAIGALDPRPACANVAEEVHWVVNNNPRDAVLCMARADVLVASLSSLSQTAAVFTSAPVFHPSVERPTNEHWDLRDKNLDWAYNWFDARDVHDRPATVQEVFERSRQQCPWCQGNNGLHEEMRSMEHDSHLVSDAHEATLRSGLRYVVLLSPLVLFVIWATFVRSRSKVRNQ
eukprot:TRINITY_DN26365_c0_g1_i1.p1 TRINITY_DN26365_c0_g1~~TRINITY_DN26365_c0_g1_i1.p1  ORF type:complete len:561 (+),score=58.65 TRINITY_DN26365_c0_g1_i1:225-1907(+)